MVAFSSMAAVVFWWEEGWSRVGEEDSRVWTRCGGSGAVRLTAEREGFLGGYRVLCGEACLRPQDHHGRGGEEER